MTFNYSEQIHARSFWGRDKHVLPTELPAVRNITFRADVAFIPVVKVNESFCFIVQALRILGSIQ